MLVSNKLISPDGVISELLDGIGANKPIAGRFDDLLDASKRGGRYDLCELQLHVGIGKRVEYHEVLHVHQSGWLWHMGRYRLLPPYAILRFIKVSHNMTVKAFTNYTIYQIIHYMLPETCVNPPDQNLIFYGYANQSIYIGFTVSMTCASGYDWNNGVSGNTPMLANCTVSSGQAVWTTVWSCTRTNHLTHFNYSVQRTLYSNFILLRMKIFIFVQWPNIIYMFCMCCMCNFHSV